GLLMYYPPYFTPTRMRDMLTRIKKIREFCGYSQKEVADRLGITQTTYSRLENGHTQLDFARLEQIAGLYGLSQVDIMTKQLLELIKLLVDHPEFKNKWKE
ncbi:helix-turn-helix transcriptional regulator, partial [Microcoleus sp. herbarium14]